MFAGLTIGLASIDRLELELQVKADPSFKLKVKRIFKVIDQFHWMLVTLLLSNAFAMEAIPIFLDRMTSKSVALLLSITAILFFGEIIPTALCTGPN